MVNKLDKNTPQRRAIVQVFTTCPQPLRIGEILQKARLIIPSIDQATIYRNLKRLVEQGWLLKITHPLAGTMYERSGKEHHHHFYCRKCHSVFELPGCGVNNKQVVAAGMTVEDHEVFFYGLCHECSRLTQEK
ncbi:MAG: transcriptional repressor [Sedimentisphaerales bacterium]|nr:transcriptional repressor [Sedimentisphaerales bacterium]